MLASPRLAGCTPTTPRCPALGAPFTAPRAQRSSRPAAARSPVLAASRQQQQRTAAAAAAAAATLAAAPAAFASAPSAEAAARLAADPHAGAAAQVVADLALLDAQSAGVLSAVLKPALSIASLLMIVRIVMSWYPELDGKAMPWTIAYTPTGAPQVEGGRQRRGAGGREQQQRGARRW